MTKKKNTPLKDEQVYSFDDIYNKLDEIQKTINKKNVQEAHALSSSPASCTRECVVDSDKLTKSVAGAMDSYMQSYQLKMVKDDEESDTEQAKSLLEDYRKELVEIKAQSATPAVTIIDKNIVEAAVTTVIEKGDTNATFITKPELPTSLKGVPGYLFFLLPWYYVRRFFADRYVKWWFRIVLFCVWLTSIFLTCIIAHDNARLNTIEKKYVLLREFARPNEDWAKKADYIEFLYTDEAEHKEEIQRLWENRRKRLDFSMLQSK